MRGRWSEHEYRCRLCGTTFLVARAYLPKPFSEPPVTHCNAPAVWQHKVSGPLCDHCGLRTLRLTYLPRGSPLEGMEQAWSCSACLCTWTLTWELREKGRDCPVHGVVAAERQPRRG